MLKDYLQKELTQYNILGTIAPAQKDNILKE
jgi:hypothetical protein